MISPLTRFRISLGAFIAGLVVSGLTAFPLLHELRILDRWFGTGKGSVDRESRGIGAWISLVRDGLEETYLHYPWIAYGTDWLAFGHLVIALFFVVPFFDPIPNRWVLVVGIIACLAVIPLAMIAGPIRGIPFYWRLLDISFGVIGILPLCYCLHVHPQIPPKTN